MATKRQHHQTHITLYHYTGEGHLGRILAGSFLKVTESNISLERTHAGPDVVWLTRDRRQKQGWQKVPEMSAKLYRAANNGAEYVELIDATTGKRRKEHVDNVDWSAVSVADKSAIRITVRLPLYVAHHWPAWSRKQGISRAAYVGLARGNDPNDWYVVPRPVPSAEWIKIERIACGDALWTATEEITPRVAEEVGQEDGE